MGDCGGDFVSGASDYESHSSSGPDVYSPGMDAQSSAVPANGMIFPTFQEASDFYTRYAFGEGFVVRCRTSTARKNLNGCVNWLCSLTCVREGKRQTRAAGDASKSVAPCGCKAKVNVKCRGDGPYVFGDLVLEHNHNMMDPEMVKFHCKNRFITLDQQLTIDNNEEAGVRPSESYRVIAHAAGGHENLNCTRKDVYDYIRNKRKKIRVVTDMNDGQEMIAYFERMKEQVQLDTRNPLHWIHNIESLDTWILV